MSDEIEIDFTKIPDRYSEHLSGPPSDEVELPPFWEGDKGIHELYSRDSLDKAFKLIKAKRVLTVDGRPDLYNVEGSELYICSVIEMEDWKVPGITCTCPNGSNRSGRPTCYHTAAVLMLHTETSQDDIEMELSGMAQVLRENP